MARTLPQLVRTLSQELYDEIVELTFTHNNKKQVQVRIDNDYRSPSLLHVCQQGRELFANGYYSNTHFFSKEQDVLRKWLLTLDERHARHLRDVTLVSPEPYCRAPSCGRFPLPTSVALAAASPAGRQQIERGLKLNCRRALYHLVSTLGRGGPPEGSAVRDVPLAALRLVVEGVCEVRVGDSPSQSLCGGG